MVDHFRDAECGVVEQLEPIDENRRYDFNYQQYTILPKTVTVLPVSFIACILIVLNPTHTTGAHTHTQQRGYLPYYMQKNTNIKFSYIIVSLYKLGYITTTYTHQRAGRSRFTYTQPILLAHTSTHNKGGTYPTTCRRIPILNFPTFIQGYITTTYTH